MFIEVQLQPIVINKLTYLILHLWGIMLLKLHESIPVLTHAVVRQCSLHLSRVQEIEICAIKLTHKLFSRLLRCILIQPTLCLQICDQFLRVNLCKDILSWWLLSCSSFLLLFLLLSLLDPVIGDLVEFDLADDPAVGHRVTRSDRIALMETTDEFIATLFEQELEGAVCVEKGRVIHIEKVLLFLLGCFSVTFILSPV